MLVNFSVYSLYIEIDRIVCFSSNNRSYNSSTFHCFETFGKVLDTLFGHNHSHFGNQPHYPPSGPQPPYGGGNGNNYYG